MAMPTVNEKFFGRQFFDSIVEWVSDNLDLDEVFLQSYVIDWAQNNLEPEEVFTDGSLEDWATKNGYVKEK